MAGNRLQEEQQKPEHFKGKIVCKSKHENV